MKSVLCLYNRNNRIKAMWEVVVLLAAMLADVVGTHACAPSLRAMNGSSGQSCSTAGSSPSSRPIQASTSGPLAWWKSMMHTSGASAVEEAQVAISQACEVSGSWNRSSRSHASGSRPSKVRDAEVLAVTMDHQPYGTKPLRGASAWSMRDGPSSIPFTAVGGPVYERCAE